MCARCNMLLMRCFNVGLSVGEGKGRNVVYLVFFGHRRESSSKKRHIAVIFVGVGVVGGNAVWRGGGGHDVTF